MIWRGVTEDGRSVMGGVFALYDTHGLPLEVAFEALRERGMVPSWVEFFDDARAAGWPYRRVLARLSEALGDVYGPAFRDVVVGRLRRLALWRWLGERGGAPCPSR